MSPEGSRDIPPCKFQQQINPSDTYKEQERDLQAHWAQRPAAELLQRAAAKGRSRRVGMGAGKCRYVDGRQPGGYYYSRTYSTEDSAPLRKASSL